MRIKRLVVAAFLAAVLGATIGFIEDGMENMVLSESFRTGNETKPSPAFEPARAAFKAKEVECLAEIVFREGRSESVGVQRLIAMTVIARRDDPDPQWPKTICGILGQRGAISHADRQIDIGPNGVATLSLALALADDVYESAWKTQLLPHGWECVRYWRVSDRHLASLKASNLQQLGITEKRTGLKFFDRLVEVPLAAKSTTAFYRDPNRCRKPLPTT